MRDAWTWRFNATFLHSASYPSYCVRVDLT